jgi:hypothetical protein
MARGLSNEESREIKRAMRLTPGISQRLHDGLVDDDGRYIIQASSPPIGQLLEAKNSGDGRWIIEVVDLWRATDS